MEEDEIKKVANPEQLENREANSPIPMESIPNELKPYIEILPPDKREGFIKALVMERRTESWFNGPLPHPDFYAGYEKVLPGSANRILLMAERQLEGEISIRKQEQNNNEMIIKGVNATQKRGQYLGSTLVLVIALMTGGLIYLGHDWVGGVIFTVLASIGAVFALRKWPKDKKEPLQKQEETD